MSQKHGHRFDQVMQPRTQSSASKAMEAYHVGDGCEGSQCGAHMWAIIKNTPKNMEIRCYRFLQVSKVFDNWHQHLVVRTNIFAGDPFLFRPTCCHDPRRCLFHEKLILFPIPNHRSNGISRRHDGPLRAFGGLEPNGLGHGTMELHLLIINLS